MEQHFTGLFISNFTMGGTFKAFGIIYVGLLDVFGAGEFTTSLATTVHSVVCIFACEFSIYDFNSLST